MLHEVKFIKAFELDLDHNIGLLLDGGLFVFEIRETGQSFPVRILKADGFLETPQMVEPPTAFYDAKYRRALIGDARELIDFKKRTDGRIYWHLFPLVRGGTSEREKKLALFDKTFRVYQCDFEINYAPIKKSRKNNPSKPPVRKLRDR